MNRITDKQIESAVNKACDKIVEGVLDMFVQSLDHYRKYENENKELGIKEISLAILTTEIANCAKMLKETLKELLCE
ncbi:MAG: hypothetical protein NC124_16750 [Clostridium sp.]|nr:hypothetical protein [Clostridium sp.]